MAVMEMVAAATTAQASKMLDATVYKELQKLRAALTKPSNKAIVDAGLAAAQLSYASTKGSILLTEGQILSLGVTTQIFAEAAKWAKACRKEIGVLLGYGKAGVRICPLTDGGVFRLLEVENVVLDIRGSGGKGEDLSKKAALLGQGVVHMISVKHVPAALPKRRGQNQDGYWLSMEDQSVFEMEVLSPERAEKVLVAIKANKDFASHAVYSEGIKNLYDLKTGIVNSWDKLTFGEQRALIRDFQGLD